MTIDPTISVGAILNALVLLVGFVVAFTRIGGRIDLLAQRIKAMEETLMDQRDLSARVAVVETTQAAQARTIASTLDDIRELRHGEGFVRGARGIDREYP